MLLECEAVLRMRAATVVKDHYTPSVEQTISVGVGKEGLRDSILIEVDGLSSSSFPR